VLLLQTFHAKTSWFYVLIDELSNYPDAAGLNSYTSRIREAWLIENTLCGDIEELKRHLIRPSNDSKAVRRIGA